MSKPAKAPACPLCGKPAQPPHEPFCCAVCQDRDLIAWLDERYVAPGPALTEDDVD